MRGGFGERLARFGYRDRLNIQSRMRRSLTSENGKLLLVNQAGPVIMNAVRVG